MKKLLASFLGASILFASCSDDSKHVDLYGEFQDRAELSLSLEDGTEIKGFEGDYCTDVVCMEKGPIDFAALNYTSVSRDAKLLIHVDSLYEITSVGGSLFKKDGTEYYRDLSFVMVEEEVYAPDPVLDVEDSEITLHVKVIFNEQGRTNFYFPLRLE